MSIAVPQDLSVEALVRDYWHQGSRVMGEPMSPAEMAREADLQTGLYHDPLWDALYGVHDGHVGERIPRGLMVGTWRVVKRNERGEVDCTWLNHKIITTVGKNALAAYLALASPIGAFMKFLSTGTGNAAPAVGDTALGGGAGNPITELASGTGSNRLTGTASSSTNVYQLQATTATSRYSGQTIQEAGMHDAAAIQTVAGTPSGVMFDRSLLSPSATMGANDTLQLTFQITFT